VQALTRFFLSLNTAFWVFLAFIVLAFMGSLSLVNNLAFFSGIDEAPLFKWLLSVHDLRKTWWIYVMIAVLAVMAVSTIFCTIEALYKKLSLRNFVLKISPQVMHIGVLFIMLGHLLTASAGFKTDMNITKGEKKTVAGNISVSVDDVKVTTDENGYYTDWQAKLLWFENGLKKHENILRPAHPLYFGEYGIYIRSVNMGPETSALIRVCRDPGALWALIGGALLSFGGIGFIYGRSRV